nr:MAG TPA: hypothetical protein [Caudoviricetes sp.]
MLEPKSFANHFAPRVLPLHIHVLHAEAPA